VRTRQTYFTEYICHAPATSLVVAFQFSIVFVISYVHT